MDKCPKCGYCDKCGRSNFQPWNPYPYTQPVYPWGITPYMITTGNQTSGGPAFNG